MNTKFLKDFHILLTKLADTFYFINKSVFTGYEKYMCNKSWGVLISNTICTNIHTFKYDQIIIKYKIIRHHDLNQTDHFPEVKVLYDQINKRIVNIDYGLVCQLDIDKMIKQLNFPIDLFLSEISEKIKDKIITLKLNQI